MKAIFVLVAAAAMAAPVAVLALPVTAQPSSVTEDLMHIQTSFDLVVPLAYEQTAPLFGPEGERAWAGKHWDPKFIHPQPAHDEQGAVFTVKHGPFSAVWVTSQFDVAGRRFQYVYFLPGIMVTVIDVRFKPIGASSTAVNVVYTRTAIAPEGNEHVQAMSEGDKTAGKEWQQAIEEHLAQSKLAAKP
jgi:hypothetical protein